MKNRAYITTYHKIIEAVAILLSVAAVIVCVVFALTSDGQVPIHFGLDGEPTAYGSAWSGLSLPVVMLITNLGMVAMICFVPVNTWNMPCKITENYAPYAYVRVITMIVLTMLCMGIMSLGGTICMYKARNVMGPFIIAMCVVLTIITIFYIVKLSVESKRYA